MQNIDIHKISFSKKELYSILKKSQSDFHNRTDEFVKQYTEKLTEFGSFVVATHHSDTIGMIAFYANSKDFVYITNVWVDKEYRGLGINGKMLKEVAKIAVDKQIPLLRLEVKKKNIQAINSYLRFGFTVVSSTEEGSFFMEKTI